MPNGVIRLQGLVSPFSGHVSTASVALLRPKLPNGLNTFVMLRSRATAWVRRYRNQQKKSCPESPTLDTAWRRVGCAKRLRNSLEVRDVRLFRFPPAREPDIAAVHLDDLATDAEAESTRVARRFGRESAFEDARDQVGRNSDTCIRNINVDGADGCVRRLFHSRGDLTKPAAVHRIGGID